MARVDLARDLEMSSLANEKNLNHSTPKYDS